MLKRLSPRRFLPPLPKWMKKGGITENLEMQSLTNLEKLFAAAAGPGRDAVPILRPMVQALHKDAIGYDPSKPVDAFHALERATDRQLDAFRSDLQQYIEDGMRETTTLPSGENSSAANVDGEEHSIQEYDSLLPRAVAGFRLLLLKHYCKGMNEALCGDDLSISFPKHEVPFRPLIDAALMGTMSERLTAHMELFKEDLNQEKLQAMYYLALEPEVVAVTQLLNDQPGSPRKVVKALNKYARTYLLDVVELNTKSRSVFNWSHPKYEGLKPVVDEETLDVPTLAKGSREFFPEGANMTAMFHKDYVGVRKLWYATKKENRKTMKNGMYFMIGTMILDLIVMSK